MQGMQSSSTPEQRGLTSTSSVPLEAAQRYLERQRDDEAALSAMEDENRDGRPAWLRLWPSEVRTRARSEVRAETKSDGRSENRSENKSDARVEAGTEAMADIGSEWSGGQESLSGSERQFTAATREPSSSAATTDGSAEGYTNGYSGRSVEAAFAFETVYHFETEFEAEATEDWLDLSGDRVVPDATSKGEQDVTRSGRQDTTRSGRQDATSNGEAVPFSDLETDPNGAREMAFTSTAPPRRSVEANALRRQEVIVEDKVAAREQELSGQRRAESFAEDLDLQAGGVTPNPQSVRAAIFRLAQDSAAGRTDSLRSLAAPEDAGFAEVARRVWGESSETEAGKAFSPTEAQDLTEGHDPLASTDPFEAFGYENGVVSFPDAERRQVAEAWADLGSGTWPELAADGSSDGFAAHESTTSLRHPEDTLLATDVVAEDVEFGAQSLPSAQDQVAWQTDAVASSFANRSSSADRDVSSLAAPTDAEMGMGRAQSDTPPAEHDAPVSAQRQEECAELVVAAAIQTGLAATDPAVSDSAALLREASEQRAPEVAVAAAFGSTGLGGAGEAAVSSALLGSTSGAMPVDTRASYEGQSNGRGDGLGDKPGSAGQAPALAHDAGNLLSALRLYSELLALSGVLHARHKHYAEDLKLLAARGEVLIERLLASCTSADNQARSLAVERPSAAGKDVPLAATAGVIEDRFEPTAEATSAQATSTEAASTEPGVEAVVGACTDAVDVAVEQVEPVWAEVETSPSVQSSEYRSQTLLQGGDRALTATAAAPTTITEAEERGAVQDASLQASTGRVEADPINLVDLLTRWGSLLSMIAHGKVEVNFGPNANLPIRVPEEAMERILVNLVHNAMTATRSSGSIRIGVGRAEKRRSGVSVSSPAVSLPSPDGRAQPLGRVVLTVDDSGCGMTEQQIARVLGKGMDRSLSQVSASETKDPAGGQRRGMGLQIVRELVESSGGQLAIYSRPGVGTRIEMEWPAMEPMVGWMHRIPPASAGLRAAAGYPLPSLGQVANLPANPSGRDMGRDIGRGVGRGEEGAIAC